MSKQASENFFNSWNTYQKVVAGDYMFHRELGTELKLALRGQFEGRPYSLLDLGCGDAAALAPLLKGQALQHYRGVDLSETALALAADNLQALPCPVELVHGDILTALSGHASYDVIHSSFALHHLPTAQKAQFFQLAAQRLNKGGLLLLIDVVREEDETLDVYHERYCDWLRGTWSALDTDEQNLVCDHLVNNDLPDPLSVLEAQARAAGLERPAPSVRYGWHWLLSFTHA